MDFEMDLEHETTPNTASADTSDLRAVSAPAIATSATADELRNRLNLAKEALLIAIEEANLEAMTEQRALLKSLPEQIILAEMKELKLRLNQIALERSENAENIKLINAVRHQKHAEYVEKVRELEPYQNAVEEWNLKLSFANNDGVLLQMENREKKARLFSLTTDLKNENI